jgi:N-(5-amino-5-carboxypentanoyl)-L-cysteinyl-D-valine synthase
MDSPTAWPSWCLLSIIVVDTVSWRIIARDLRTLYEGKALEAKASSYRQ